LTAARIEKTQQFFRERGSRAIFAARFVAGLRMPAFFVAGAMGVTYPRFFVCDLLGSLISCPTSICVAYAMSAWIGRLESANLVIGIIVGVLVAVYIVHWVKKNHPPSPPAILPETPAVHINSARAPAETPVAAPVKD